MSKHILLESQKNQSNTLPTIGNGTICAADIDSMLDKLRTLLLSQHCDLSKPINTDELSKRVRDITGEDNSITPNGLGIDAGLNLFSSLLSKQGIPTNHSGYLAYIGVTPTPAAALMDGLLSASGMIGSAWLGGAGFIWAENEVLSWLANLAGLPKGSGGCFVSGGTAGNLSALLAARNHYRTNKPDKKNGILLVCESAHASIHNCANLLDLVTIIIPCDHTGRATSENLKPILQDLSQQNKLDEVVAIAASAGSTNTGQIDNLSEIGLLAKKYEIWFHVDAAYGGGFLCLPELRPQFDGIEMANSIIIDPHKGLFTPYDCCALIFSEPRFVTSAFSQDAAYLDHVNASPEWNPMHYAFHLSRRARGLPLWFSLSVYGTRAFIASLRTLIAITEKIKQKIISCKHLELIKDTSLSVILFKRPQWDEASYYIWADRCLTEGLAFIVPTKFHGETVLRLCIMTTEVEDERIDAVLKSLSDNH